ncbi:hypothetical protein A0H81_01724 [Grifola frondosa]|uniref:Uncharacterized protein n=1 Tax=Grifola frondosa TaxID=5627 RepID=A0A1C7MLZ3_GRIFR|nr:hypothetical protein A0H81_01724 [Grifola frondosa]
MPAGGDRADSSYGTDLPGLADLPPAIKHSLGILAKACKDDSLVTSQAERDASVQKLGISVRSALQSLVVVDDWAKNPLVRDTVGSVLETIVECINFLNVYSKNIQAGDTASSIQRWQEALDEFVSKFDLSVPIRSVEKVQLDEFLSENALLEKLPHAANVHYKEGRSCLFGTQEDILRIISQWIDLQAPNRNVLWLHGIAGVARQQLQQPWPQFCLT